MALRRKRVALGIAALLAAGLVLPPFINVNRYRLQVADAMSRALGRQVTVGGVSLRLFPQPGFVLDNVVVADDPAINAEPLLRADEVTALLRLTSLWRGRLEVASLNLSDPSLNLARTPEGRWNLQSLLYKVSQTPAAPTAKIRPEARPRFPYIEADGGRINLKLGVEKTVYALTDAKFALWLASENQWQLRLEAQPMRTDANLSDTGTIRLEGTLGRADRLASTRLDLRLRLEDAQLGQLTHIIFGRDRGWRGSVMVDARLQGTPELMKTAVAARVDDFRRYDIMNGGAMRLAARCQGFVSLTRQQASDVDCQAPVGRGVVMARGSASGFTHDRSYDLSVAVENLPASAALELVQRMKRDLPEDLQASGTVDAALSLRQAAGEARLWTGAGNAAALELRSSQLDDPLTMGNLHFFLDTPGETAARGAGAGIEAGHPYLQVATFPVKLGGTAAALAQGRFTGSGYALGVQGEAALPRLLQVAAALGVAGPRKVASGPVKVDLQLAGGWTGFAAPQVTGVAQLHNDALRIPGMAQDVEIAGAAVSLSENEIRVQNLSAALAGSPSTVSGSLRVPRKCPAASCPVEFQLRADQVSTDELNRLLNPRLRPRPWYRMLGLSSGPERSPLSSLEAQGQIAIARLMVKSVAATHVAAEVRISGGKVWLTNVAGEVLGGKHQGQWQADFTGSSPVYTGEGTLHGVNMAKLAAQMQDDWASGALDVSYRAVASGWNARELLTTAGGSPRFDWRAGALSRVALGEGGAPLKFHRFTGEAELRDQTLQFSPSKMEMGNGIYTISGTASLDQRLGLHLARNGSPVYDVSGTLGNPKVSRAAATQAAQVR